MSRSRLAALVLALLTAVSLWLSAGVVFAGDVETRIAALPSIWILVVLAVTCLAAALAAKLEIEHAWPLAISLVVWLPFVPVERLPASLLMWDGPIELMVWLVVVAGLVAARPPTLPPAFGNRLIAPWLAAVVLAVSSVVAFSEARNVIPGGDEPHYLAATQSLLHDADLRVANNYEKGEYLEYFPGRLEPHFLKRSTSGEIYSIHAPGVSVIVLPAFAVAGYLGAVATMIVLAALSAALAWRVAFAISKSAGGAWLGVAGVFLSAPYFFHTFTIYPEIIGGFCVLAGAWLLIELAEGRDASERTLLVVGALLAVLPWLHSRFAVLAGIIGLLITARLATRSSALRRIAAFLVTPAIAAVAWFAFFYVIWGSPSPAAPYGGDTSTSAAYIPRGLIGLLFDQQFGVIATAPIYVMAAIGGLMLIRSRPRLAMELALIVIPYAIAVASYAMWWGGAAAPGRFLVAILPLAVLPIAAGYAESKTFRALALVLVAVSAVLLVLRTFEDNGRFIYNNRSGIDATIRWLSANVDLPSAMPSVHTNGGYRALRLGVIWLAGFGIAATMIGVLARRRSVGGRMALTGLLMAYAFIACEARGHSDFLRAGPGIIDVPADFELRRDRELVMFGRLHPSWQTTIVEFPSLEPKTAEHLLRQLAIRVDRPAMSLEHVPAGEYIVEGPAGTSPGRMTISVGGRDGPIAEPPLDDLRNPHTPFRLRLPVMARTLNFRVDSTTNDDGDFTMRPIGVLRAASRVPATRAARYGHARAFFFDEWAYPERDGFWTRANGRATVVIDADEGLHGSGIPISITAGAISTTVTLSVGSWEETVALAAGQTHDVTLPPVSEGVEALSIRSGPGFRPSERDPGSRDVRSLAAWIAIH